MYQHLRHAIHQLLPPIVTQALRSGRNAIRRSREEQDAPTRQRGSGWYDKKYSESKEYRKHYTESVYYPTWTLAVDRLLRARVESILDIGCGAGQFASLLWDKGLRAYTGIDFSYQAIALARDACPGAEFVVEDVFASPLLTSTDFNAFVCFEVLEHVDRDLELLRRLPPGARFYGSVPNFPSASHIRWFDDCRDVTERYATVLDTIAVDHHRIDRGTQALFLIEGITK